ncbi:hypothetical protein [uncultured Psychroserpens sp.]|uniref:CIS tube protein n=1 Tax=uncultured Psychroserpens sp. TaxID=255436 RepID=UPI002610C83D|nr:hypothetical protein [uncultured Psychroserpens sp.]
MNESGKLVKVLIHAYDDEEFKIKSSTSPDPIALPVNPESFNRNLKVTLNRQQGQGNQGTNPDYRGTEPEVLKLDFVLDETNSIQGYKPIAGKQFVKDELNALMNTVYKMNCGIHRPNFLKIHWGTLVFTCVLTDLALNYTLFKPNGDPLRIKVSATFLEYLSQKERVARECKKSPDLTHVKQVKAGDRLDWLTHQIYKDPKYITQIARANDLTTFRKIKPGVTLVFPPLVKTAE